uniref:PPM-type phosphatase domain-containing protein n=1 Tax=Timema cristinae TaxID=61476 RepID=A0A7R9CDE6_TIMCR|nr:unnamed protein product [Timema cristinae]
MACVDKASEGPGTRKKAAKNDRLKTATEILDVLESGDLSELEELLSDEESDNFDVTLPRRVGDPNPDPSEELYELQEENIDEDENDDDGFPFETQLDLPNEHIRNKQDVNVNGVVAMISSESEGSEYPVKFETIDLAIVASLRKNEKHCPSSLITPLTKIVLDEVKTACKKQPAKCGFQKLSNLYQPLKLMQVVTRKVNEVCLRYLDDGQVSTLPPPELERPISACAIKNTRRRMEDRHVIIEDFHTLFNIQDDSPASYYAVFDGHAGTDAAVYSVCHLHQFLAESPFYPTDPVQAFKEAFLKTNFHFLEKSNSENLHSGTTALCALLRPQERKVYVAWLGDSQALLDERHRIEEMGGCVWFWGTWRVNGQLAVSRAIGVKVLVVGTSMTGLSGSLWFVSKLEMGHSNLRILKSTES